MWTEKIPLLKRLAVLAGVFLLGGLVTWAFVGGSQGKRADEPAKDAHEDIPRQLRAVQSRLAEVEAGLKAKHAADAPSSSSGHGGGGMAGMGDGSGGDMMGMMHGKGGTGAGKGGMGMMDMDKMEMMGMMGMMGMGKSGGTGAMGQMQMTAALPGFPGASHIYHVGATGFFLDHPQHVKLSDKQQHALNQIKEKALLAKAAAQRKIDDAEQQLWTLTSSDSPDAAKVEAKVREIEKLRGDQRLEFIRAVGEAATILTDEQRQAVLGDKPPMKDKQDAKDKDGHQHQHDPKDKADKKDGKDKP